jgi:hypothetical protein
VRHCTYWDTQISVTGNPNNSAIKMDTCSSILIIDNIGYKQYPVVQINGFTPSGVSGGGSSGNVVAYNLGWVPGNSDSALGPAFSSHDSQDTATLYEGNAVNKLEIDAYYGSCQQPTFARNLSTGYDVDGNKTTIQIAVQIGRATRHSNVVGNVLGWSGQTFTVDPQYAVDSYTSTIKLIYRLGYPGTGNTNFNGTCEPSAGDNWADWGTDNINGFLELDLDVYNTTLLKGNYNSQDAAIPAAEALAGATIASSYFLTAKPAFFASLAWPAYDPTTPVFAKEAIPAGYRYTYGADPVSTPAGSRRNPAALGVGLFP